VIVRLSDFKSNEYANLIGGKQYEPHEENPMIGFRGASRYVSIRASSDCFALECRAVKKVREEMGLTNAWVMIPFVRTVGEAQASSRCWRQRPGARRERPQAHHDVRGAVERPAGRRVPRSLFDGFSIGSNDLTQLTLGLDRDSASSPHLFDERIRRSRSCCRWRSAPRAKGKYIGICGQGPSDHPDLAEWLMEQGIESVSLNPDTVVDTWLALKAR
jgi:pyruvate,water dikinase